MDALNELIDVLTDESNLSEEQLDVIGLIGQLVGVEWGRPPASPVPAHHSVRP